VGEASISPLCPAASLSACSALCGKVGEAQRPLAVVHISTGLPPPDNSHLSGGEAPTGGFPAHWVVISFLSKKRSTD